MFSEGWLQIPTKAPNCVYSPPPLPYRLSGHLTVACLSDFPWQSTCLSPSFVPLQVSHAGNGLVKPLFNIRTGRQSKTTFSLSVAQHKHTLSQTKPCALGWHKHTTRTHVWAAYQPGGGSTL